MNIHFYTSNPFEGSYYYLYYKNKDNEICYNFQNEFFKQFGLSTKRVNSIAKKNNILIDRRSSYGKLTYNYKNEDSMINFVNELNSYILLNKFLN